MAGYPNFYLNRWPSPPPPIMPPSPPPPFIGWPTADRTRSKEALQNQNELDDKISQTLRQLDSGAFDANALKAALLFAKDKVDAMHEYFSHQFRHHPEIFNERRDDESTTASEVFEIPELLEMILEHLDVPDLLRFYQCSKSIRDSIEASSKLQQQLSLRAAPEDSHLRLPLRNLTRYQSDVYAAETKDLWEPFGPLSISQSRPIGFSTYERMSHRPSRYYNRHSDFDPIKPHAEDRTTEIHAAFYVLPGQVLPNIGSRIRRMFVTQPPVKQLSVTLNCCPSANGYPAQYNNPPAQDVSNANGLTVGDLYDYTEKLLDQHRNCSAAYSGLLEDDGTVQVGVRFVGKIQLQADDPIFLRWKKSQQTRDEHDQKHRRRSAKLEVFCNAKRNATANDEPVPTMAEFMAAHGEETDWHALAWPQQSSYVSNGPFGLPPLAPQAPPPPISLPSLPLPSAVTPSPPPENATEGDENPDEQQQLLFDNAAAQEDINAFDFDSFLSQ